MLGQLFYRVVSQLEVMIVFTRKHADEVKLYGTR